MNIIETCKQYSALSVERLQANMDSIDYIELHNIVGDVVEVGVWKGGSILAMILKYEKYYETARQFYLYDTFEGMTPPSDVDKDHSGRSAETLIKTEKEIYECCASYDMVKNNIERHSTYPHVHYVVGDICKNTTYPKNPIALLRLDTDWYESTKFELEMFYPRVSPGGVVIIDDYGHWKGCRQAVDEFLKVNPEIKFRYIDYTGIYFIKPM